MWKLNKRENGMVEFLCEHGIGHYPVWYREGSHGCDGCCSNDNFPGRQPRPGDLALCGLGTLGLIVSGNKHKIEYEDGGVANAWPGIKMTGKNKGNSWSSQNPIIIGTFFEFADMEITVEDYVMTRLPIGVTWHSDR